LTLQHEKKAQVTLVAFINGVAPIEIYIMFKKIWGIGSLALAKSSLKILPFKIKK
jgi:hypothetical protein